MKGIATAILLIVLVTCQVDAAKRKRKWVILEESITAVEAKVDQLGNSLAALSDMVTPLTGLPSAVEQLDAKMVAPQCEAVPTCPEGWSDFQQSCYLIVDQHMTWNQAKDNCISLGGYLAEVGSQEENDFVFDLMSSTETPGSDDGPYLGGIRSETDGQWYWKHSDTPISYFSWIPDEPTNGEGEDCIHIRFFSDSRWNDLVCDYLTDSICEREME